MNYKALALAAFITKTHAHAPIAQYQPGSDVVDHSLIDLDQKSLEDAIYTEFNFPSVKGMAIYSQGGHSKSIVTITLDAPLPRAVAKKTAFTGSESGGGIMNGKAYEETPAGSTTLKILYEPKKCMVGALKEGDKVFDGCLIFVGEVSDGTNKYSYTTPGGYADNTNKRTLKGFATAVQSKMIAIDVPEKNALEFNNYYGVENWGDVWITNANEGKDTCDIFKHGCADFSQYGFDGKYECIKKSTSYVQTLVYALHEFESSVAACVPGVSYDDQNDNAIHKWDEGVAFYVGSTPGANGWPDGGKFHWALAGKRCKDFRTCGKDGGEGKYDGEGVSNLPQVNHLIRDQFNKGKIAIYEGKCDVALEASLRIQQLAYVPLIQGTIRYAHKVAKKVTEEKGQAEGAVFASGVLPHIHAQGPKGRAAAQIIYDNMKASKNPQTSFPKVKEAFESVYDLLGIDCEMIGGYMDDNDEYYTEAPYNSTPCESKLDDGGSTFAWAGMGLSMTCKELANVKESVRASACTDGGGSAMCPQTCKGKGVCTDKRTAKFIKNKNSGKMMNCNKLSKLPANKRRQQCNKAAAKETCPVTCKNFCDWTTPYKMN